MRYEGKLYRPPSEANSYILQATIGCSWNKCTYCDMYRDKKFRVRELDEILEDISMAGAQLGDRVQKVFVADGDALIMEQNLWQPILLALKQTFPRLRRVSCYAMASNILDKTPAVLADLRASGLTLLYIGPESGDDRTLRRIAKGSTFDEHVEASRRAREAGLDLSAIFLLGVGGVERATEHAQASARLVTEMDPKFVSALTVTVVPTTPLARAEEKGIFVLPEVHDLLTELRTFVDESNPTNAIFRTNHASNHLPLAGRLPRDRQRIVAVIDQALNGEIPLRDEWSRGL